MGISEVFLYAGMVLRFPIYFLLMTVSCFVEQRRRSAKIFLIYSRSMKQVQGQKKKNRDKTNIFFSTNTQLDMQTRIQNILGVPAIRQYEKYLGLPALVGRAKKQSFAYIKERVWRKLQGWKEKLLSQAGREILIKSVI